MNIAVLCLAIVMQTDSEVTQRERAALVSRLASLQDIALGVEPELRKIYNGLLHDLPARYRRTLKGVLFRVVAKDEYVLLDTFSAYSTKNSIVVSAGLWRRINYLAFSAAHDQLYKTEYATQCLATILGFERRANAKWWSEYGRAVDEFDERGSLWQKVAALEEAYLMAIIAHEQAHIYLGHFNTPDVSLCKRRENELEADHAALKMLYQMDPAGDHVLSAVVPLSYLLIQVMMVEYDEGERAMRAFMEESEHPHPVVRLRQTVAYFEGLQDERWKSLSQTASSGLADIKRVIRLFEESDFVQP